MVHGDVAPKSDASARVSTVGQPRQPETGTLIAMRAKSALQRLSEHSGIPAVVLGALILVVSYRVFRKLARLALEVAIVAIVLFALTHFGVITW